MEREWRPRSGVCERARRRRRSEGGLLRNVSRCFGLFALCSVAPKLTWKKCDMGHWWVKAPLLPILFSGRFDFRVGMLFEFGR